MIAFDTNHLVRHIVQDDPAQSRVVASLLAREVAAGRSVRLLDVVLVETYRVLESVYGFDRKAWCEVLAALLEDGAFSFEDPDLLRAVLERHRRGKADFADYLILVRAEREGLELRTFDKRLARELR